MSEPALEIIVDSKQAELLIDNLTPGVSRAMVRALNRGIGSGRTQMVADVARDTGLKARDVRKALVMENATRSRPIARLAASLKRLPLIQFDARGPEPSRGRGRGVSYKLAGSRGRLPHAFIATMRSGHRGVFMRKAKARLGIRELRGPSIGHVFGKYRRTALVRAQEVFEDAFTHELAFETGEKFASARAEIGLDV